MYIQSAEKESVEQCIFLIYFYLVFMCAVGVYVNLEKYSLSMHLLFFFFFFFFLNDIKPHTFLHKRVVFDTDLLTFFFL